jgi:hypothetical protein
MAGRVAGLMTGFATFICSAGLFDNVFISMGAMGGGAMDPRRIP